MSDANSDKANKSIDEHAFRRVFRFHPRAWREQNEAVASGVLMDAAEATGSTRVRLADRLSIYGHAASTWLDRGISRSGRETLASLALGTGIALGVMHFWTFGFQLWLMNTQLEGAGSSAHFPISISAQIVNVLWIIAALAFVVRKPSAARWIAALVFLACIGTIIMRLGLKGLSLESIITPTFLGLWAALSLLGRVRLSLVWKTMCVVAPLFGVAWWFLSRPMNDEQLWNGIFTGLFFALVALFVVLLTLAAGRRGNAACLGVIYAVPWTFLMFAGWLLNGFVGTETFIMIIGWLTASIAVLGIARLTTRRRMTTTDP
jgi:hypothetical protein